MKPILGLVAFALLILSGSVGAQGASLTTTVENNESSTLLWSGNWAFAVNQNVAPANITLLLDSPSNLLGKGPWSVSLTVEKGYSGGDNTYKMSFSGKHNPDGESVTYGDFQKTNFLVI